MSGQRRRFDLGKKFWLAVSACFLSIIFSYITLEYEEWTLFPIFVLLAAGSALGAGVIWKNKRDPRLAARDQAIWSYERSLDRSISDKDKRNFRIFLGFTIFMLLVTIVTWEEWIWPLWVTFFSLVVTASLYSLGHDNAKRRQRY